MLKEVRPTMFEGIEAYNTRKMSLTILKWIDPYDAQRGEADNAQVS